jgi:hypothetical protein
MSPIVPGPELAGAGSYQVYSCAVEALPALSIDCSHSECVPQRVAEGNVMVAVPLLAATVCSPALLSEAPSRL